ncbi:MAG: hypothetical protein K0S76_170 [Herbinix sp.]|jgi:excisionase family DNA binding protein|nr:hypothetical protein [Herbinix sp.]
MSNIKVRKSDLFDVDLLKQAQEAQVAQAKQDAQAFGASVKVILMPATNETSVTVTNDTVTNVTVTTDTSDLDPYLLPHEAALMLGVTRKTIREWYNNKIIKGIVTGGGQHLRVPTSEVYRLKGLRYTAPTEIPPESYYGFEN